MTNKWTKNKEKIKKKSRIALTSHIKKFGVKKTCTITFTRSWGGGIPAQQSKAMHKP